MAVSFVETPLTLSTAVSSWQWDLPTLAVTGGLAWGYHRAHTRQARRGDGVGRGRGYCFLFLGCAAWAVAATSFVGVYADTLFWVRALQVVILLFVVPFGLALGRPVSVLRGALGAGGGRRLDTALSGRGARILAHPATTSLAMLATPWLLYLTGWYPAVLEHHLVDQITRIVLVVVGFGYFYARLQADPVPRRYSQMISITITFVEVIGDGLLGLVLWLGPLIAAGHYAARTWGPDPRTDQIIGAGILWILGDVIGVPFLLVLMRAFTLDDRATAAAIDAELDAAELDAARGPARAAAAAEEHVSEPPAAHGLWWENDPQLQDRFRRER
ncbi:cytochrome c oxidase assembly protein [Rhodococcus olei]|uniref:Cytochrome c oxidase assembly protein n=1 Tax=Rhodococcus olei TaxID=2161675 RepID=A0ABP8PQZ0_9NOCA